MKEIMKYRSAFNTPNVSSGTKLYIFYKIRNNFDGLSNLRHFFTIKDVIGSAL